MTDEALRITRENGGISTKSRHVIFHKSVGVHATAVSQESACRFRRILPTYLRERERERDVYGSLSRPPEARLAETDDSLSLSLSLSLSFSRSSIPVTAEWLRRNCREVRSARGFYQRLRSVRQHEKMHSADGLPQNSLSRCVTLEVSLESSGPKRTSWRHKRRSEFTPQSEDSTGKGSERISQGLKIQSEFCLQYVDHKLLEKRSIMRKWTLPWKLPELPCGLWLHVVLVVSRVCVCDGDGVAGQASVTDCSKHERHTRNYDYMEGGDVRIRRLYSRTQWFLMIDENGNINGTQDPNNCYSVLEIRTVSEGGVLAIKGLKSQYYISMNRTGMLQGKKDYNDSCNFKEVFLENYYTAYASVRKTKDGKEMFIALSKNGRPLKGKKTRRENITSHFIPRKCREDEKKLA